MSILKATDAVVLQAVSEVLRGDRGAFETIVLSYEKQLFRLSLSFLGSREEAEEAVQDIFITAYRKLDSFKLERAFYPWLYTIALNILRSRYRRCSRKRALTTELTVEPTSTSPSPESEAMRSAEEAEMRRCVDALPRKLREVIVLYYYQNEPVASIAEILGLGEENVKSRLFRARKRLKAVLERTWNEHETK